MSHSLKVILIALGYLGLLIHPVLSVPIVLLYTSSSRYCVSNAILTLSLSLAAITSTRQIYVNDVPDDLITYVSFSNEFPNMTWVEFLFESRLEPLFYLPYYFFGPFEAHSLLFINSFIATFLFFTAIYTLSKRFGSNFTFAIFIGIALFPFEIISNTPRQVAASCLLFTLFNSKWRILSLFLHKASIIPYVLSSLKTKKSIYVFLILIPLLFFVGAGVIENVFFARVKYFLIQEGTFSNLIALMVIVSFFTLIVKREDKLFWLAIFGYLCMCAILSQFGPLGIRLSYLVYSVFIIQMAWIIKHYNSVLGSSMTMTCVYILALTVFIYRISGNGAHEPFTGIPFSEAFFWGI